MDQGQAGGIWMDVSLAEFWLYQSGPSLQIGKTKTGSYQQDSFII